MEQAKNRWRYAGVSVAVLILLILVLYQHTVLYLTGLWNQFDVGEYAHGYLVLAISGYLVLSNRQVLQRLSPQPEYRALFGVLAASMLWMVAALVDVEMVQSIGLLLLIFFTVWVALGNQSIRVLAFPIIFVVFAIPIWFPLSPILQDLTADIVFWAARLLSIPAFREDNMIMLPAGTLSIEEACSGLRYFLAALTLGMLYAYMNYSSLRARLIVVFIAAGAAIVANILRVFIIVYLGYTTEMQHPVINDHLMLGWYLFGGLVVILLVIDARINMGMMTSVSNGSSEKYGATLDETIQTATRYFVLIIGTGILLSATPVMVYLVNNHSSNMNLSSVSPLPAKLGDWKSVEGGNDSWKPVYHGAVVQKQSYKYRGDEITYYLAYYPLQKQGEELINDLNNISNKNRWRSVYPNPRIRKMDNQYMLEQQLANVNGKQLLVWYWYNVAGTVTTSKYEAKVLQVLGLLAGKPWAYVSALAIEKRGDIDSNRKKLKGFISSIEKTKVNVILE